MSSWTKQHCALLVLLCCTVFFYSLLPSSSSSSPSSSLLPSTALRSQTGGHELSIPMQPFPEEPWRTPSTLQTRTLASTPFAR
jgi:hypothetical protein